MSKVKNSLAWIEGGYNQFAAEGLDGLHIEPLARKLGLNKSGFYHYFGDLEGFGSELLQLHESKVSQFIQELREAKSLDPEYLHLLVKYSTTVMFQMHLTRTNKNTQYFKVGEELDMRVGLAVQRLWNDFLAIPEDPDLALRYYNIVRDMYHTRISFQNLNFSANCICRDEPESPVGKRVLVITPKDVLPTWAVRPGWPKFA